MRCLIYNLIEVIFPKYNKTKFILNLSTYLKQLFRLILFSTHLHYTDAQWIFALRWYLMDICPTWVPQIHLHYVGT